LNAEESANPVYLNGVEVIAPCPLKNGDILSLGFCQIRYTRPTPAQTSVQPSAES
jgi:hypothetical protein